MPAAHIQAARTPAVGSLAVVDMGLGKVLVIGTLLESS